MDMKLNSWTNINSGYHTLPKSKQNLNSVQFNVTILGFFFWGTNKGFWRRCISTHLSIENATVPDKLKL